MLIRRLLVIALLLSTTPLAAYAQGSSSTGTIAGTVKSPSGASIQGAVITAEGAARGSTTSDAQGNFKLALAPGVYRLTVSKGGYVPATLVDVAVFSGGTQPIDVTMTLADLTSLRTIASVSTSPRGSAINTGAASSDYIPAVAIQNLANPGVNDVIQHLPDAVIQRIGSQPDTTIVLGGVQPYETQVLIDGHPLSLGEYGVWLSEYFPSALLGGVETQVGPGNTTPFASTAVGGTANLVTPNFTTGQTFNAIVGTDTYQSQYSSILATGSVKKLQYVVGASYGSSNGPLYQTTKFAVSPDYNAAGQQSANLPGNTGIIQFAGDASGTFGTKGDLFKLRYNFSPTTAFEVGAISIAGAYNPQGTAYGQYVGQMTVEPCLTYGFPGPYYTCNNPAYNGLIGQSVPGYVWYPGSEFTFNQTIFTGQFRTSIGNDTLLIRPYAGSITQFGNGTNEDAYPLFWAPQGVCGATTGGQTSASCLAFQNNCNVTNAGYGYYAGVVNGTGLCNQTQFFELNQDRLYGNTLTYLHPAGNNLFTFTYDFHGDNSYGYYAYSGNVTVPPTLEHYNTLSLVSDIRASSTLDVKAGLYYSMWSASGSQDITPTATPNPTTGVVPQTGLQRSVSRFDPHIALTYQPTSKASYRAAWGTSETFPFAGYISGQAYYTLPSATTGTLAPNGFVTFKSPNLGPETASEFSLGTDQRLARNGILRLDLQNTNIANVFELLTTPGGIATWPGAVDNVPSAPIGALVPTNSARLSVMLAKVGYYYTPPAGFGYNGSMVFESSQVKDIPNAFYGIGPSLPANNQQTCGFGNAIPGSTTCIPYMKGYYQVNYTWKGGAYAGLGADFEGKNNTYFQPPFLQFDLTAKMPVTKFLEVQVSVQNLLNTNDFFYLPQPNSGTTTTLGVYGSPYCAASTFCQTSLPSTLVPAPPRTLRVQLRWHDGRP